MSASTSDLRSKLAELQDAVEAMRNLHTLLLDRLRDVQVRGDDVLTDREVVRALLLRDELQQEFGHALDESEEDDEDVPKTTPASPSVIASQKICAPSPHFGLCAICHECCGAQTSTNGSFSGKCLRLASCGHVFCASCIVPWLRISDTCPTCRAVVKPPSVEAHTEVRRHPGSRTAALRQQVTESREASTRLIPGVSRLLLGQGELRPTRTISGARPASAGAFTSQLVRRMQFFGNGRLGGANARPSSAAASVRPLCSSALSVVNREPQPLLMIAGRSVGTSGLAKQPSMYRR